MHSLLEAARRRQRRADGASWGRGMRRRRWATSRRRYVARGVWLRCARWRATAFAVSALLASLTRVRGCWPGPVRMRSLWGLRRGRLSGRWPCCPHSMRTRVATAARPEGRVVWCPGCARGGCVVIERGGALCRCSLSVCLRACLLSSLLRQPARMASAHVSVRAVLWWLVWWGRWFLRGACVGRFVRSCLVSFPLLRRSGVSLVRASVSCAVERNS